MRSPRASARREMWRRLNDARRTADILRSWWDVGTKVYVPQKERTDSNEYLRERRLDEYPENQKHYWASTIDGIDSLIYHLAELRTYAFEQYEKTEE